MIRPPYAALRAAFPQRNQVPMPALYASIGHPEYATDGRMINTCAVRLSVALVGCGVPIQPGNITVLAGKHVGARLESGQARLSKCLTRLCKALRNRRGVINFHQLYGATDQQGHVDLVAPDTWGEAICADDCYWQSVEVLFWPLA
jgi:hypothetical protein